MMILILLLTIVPLLGCGEERMEKRVKEVECTLLDCVDPFIGTGGGGFSQPNAFPGASLPFGMVQPSPDTHGGPLARLGFAHTAGYWYYDTRIEGFSQIHLYGTGIAEGGYITLMPTLGIGEEKTNLYGYAQGFDHRMEWAEPGYYRVVLEDGIVVELTATERVAYHRYTFPTPSEDPPVVILDLTHALGQGAVTQATLVVSNTAGFSGSLFTRGEFAGGAGGFPLFFSAEISPPFSGLLTFSTTSPQKTATPVRICEGAETCRNLLALSPLVVTAEGKTLGAFLVFPPQSTEVEIRIGISYVDPLGAEKNLRGEGNLPFDEVRTKAQKRWEEVLSRVRIIGGDPVEKRKFYTALYHTLLMPNLMSDRDGRYRGLDGRIHTLEGGRFYSNLSLWDTYRTLHPLLILLYPEFQEDILISLFRMGEELGYYPRWPLASVETGVMVGIPAHIVLSESYLKGITASIPWESAYDRMISDIEAPQRDGAVLSAYRSRGYVPDRFGGSVALTLEYAHAVHSLSLLARALGKDRSASSLLELALGYRQLFDPETRVFRPRDESGTFKTPFDPSPWGADYVEGNAWHYLYMVPWDPEGYSTLFGSREEALRFFWNYFERSRWEDTPYFTIRGVRIELPRTLYWPMNEPSLYAPLIGALLGEPNLSARIIRWVVETFYNTTPDGIPGNDDGGTMSAWLVFSALGFFPIPGTDRYILTGSLFPEIELHTPRGAIRILNHQVEHPMENLVGRLGDDPAPKTTVTHGELLSSRVLRFSAR
jgi:predicted alpha-1,2-mannosidase